ncbi:MAG: beta-mannosidase [Lachnospiraceae bacterium]|nr:beta-mannosidase [Lachnospiraceae bacterium]
MRPVNPNATKEACELLEYLYENAGRAVISGQHTQTVPMEEVSYLHEVTGKYPKLQGFELLGYSPNVNYEDASEACITEVKENLNTVETAIKWAKETDGIVSYCFHWFSPIGGHDKSFYQKNTDFDARRILAEGSDEEKSFYSDLRIIGDLLRKFQNENIPILWRPFHEADGDWFWWGSKGHETGRDLYIKMYHFFVDELHLNHLLWVWNSPAPEGYPGDEYVDVISRDVYLMPGTKTDYKKEYEELIRITDAPKVAALGEVGLIPDMEIWEKSKVPWAYFMTWSKEFCMTEEYNTKEDFKKNYASPYMITRQK